MKAFAEWLLTDAVEHVDPLVAALAERCVACGANPVAVNDEINNDPRGRHAAERAYRTYANTAGRMAALTSMREATK